VRGALATGHPRCSPHDGVPPPSAFSGAGHTIQTPRSPGSAKQDDPGEQHVSPIQLVQEPPDEQAAVVANPEPLRPEVSAADDPILRVLLQHGRLVPLRPESHGMGKKHPWLRSVIGQATKDPVQIRLWEKEKPDCHWGLRLDDDSDIIVIDIESAARGKGDGAATIARLEQEHGALLPPGPVERSLGGGLHSWLRIPKQFHGMFKNWSAVFGCDSGVDIRVARGMVAIPVSSSGRWTVSPAEVEIPILPAWFCEALVQHRPQQSPPEKIEGTPAARVRPQGRPALPEPIRNKQRFVLFRGTVFMGLWHKTRRLPNGRSHSEYEIALCTKAYAHGFSDGQVLTLIREWWAAHPVAIERLHAARPDQVQDYDESRLVSRIMPAAYAAAEPFINAWNQRMAAARAAKNAARTRTRVLAYLGGHGPATPSDVVAGLSGQAGMGAPTVSAVKKALSRMAVEGQVTRSSKGVYRGEKDGECITTTEMSPQREGRVSGRGWKVPSDLVWYAETCGVELEPVAAQVRSELSSILGKVATKPNFVRRLISEIEDQSGLAPATQLQRAVNGYYRRAVPSRPGKRWRIRIGEARAVAMLRDLEKGLWPELGVEEAVDALRRIAEYSRPPLKVIDLTGCLIQTLLAPQARGGLKASAIADGKGQWKVA
jgi:hypothetical protein